MLRKFLREVRSRIWFRAHLIHSALTMKPMAGAEDPPPADPPATPPPDPQPPAPKTFTQEDLDRVVQERLARERAKFSDYDDLKGKAQKWEEHEEQNRTELENEQQAREAAERARDEALSLARTTARRAAITAAAAEHGVDPDIAFALLSTQDFKVVNKDDEDNSFEVTVADDGQVTGAAEAVQALAEQKNLVGNPTPPPPGDGGTRNPAPAPDLDEQIRKANEEGDVSTAVSLNNQKLLQAMQEQG